MSKIKIEDDVQLKVNDYCFEALKELVKMCNEELNDEGKLPSGLFLHILLCHALGLVYENAPSEKEANKVVKRCLEQVKEVLKKEKKDE
jgi:hypothetical protein